MLELSTYMSGFSKYGMDYSLVVKLSYHWNELALRQVYFDAVILCPGVVHENTKINDSEFLNRITKRMKIFYD